jgi:hypothetical protein
MTAERTQTQGATPGQTAEQRVVVAAATTRGPETEGRVDELLPPTLPYEKVGFGWGAVLAGLVVAVGLDLLFGTGLAAMDLGLFDAQSDTEGIATASAVAWVITSLLALAAGSWVAGRMCNAQTELEGSVHGAAVWGTGAVLLLAVGTTAAGTFVSGLFGVLERGVGTVGEVAAVAAPNWEEIETQLDEGLEAANLEQASSAASGSRFADRSRLVALAGRQFSVDGPELSAGERTELVELLSTQLGISQQEAQETLSQWDSVWNDAVRRFEAARDDVAAAVERGAEALATAAGWSALAMVLGLATALGAGCAGARSRLRHKIDFLLPFRRAKAAAGVGTR